MENPVEKARQIIASNRYLSLATSTRSGEVWIAPVAYVVDEDYSFYFYSAIDSIHIENTKYNPNVAFAIYDSTLSSDDADGVQAAGMMAQVDKVDLPKIVELYWKQSFPDPQVRARWERPFQDFLKESFPVQRFFQISPTEIYKLDTTILEVDRRIEINLTELRKQPAKQPTLAQL